MPQNIQDVAPKATAIDLMAAIAELENAEGDPRWQLAAVQKLAASMVPYFRGHGTRDPSPPERRLIKAFLEAAADISPDDDLNDGIATKLGGVVFDHWTTAERLADMVPQDFAPPPLDLGMLRRHHELELSHFLGTLTESGLMLGGAIDVVLPYGVQSGELVLLAGRPGVGKTRIASRMAADLRKQCPVVFVSNEMFATEIYTLILTAVSGINLPVQESPFSGQNAGSG